jgi:hypothetical protein
MPVESEQARARHVVAEQALEQEQAERPVAAPEPGQEPAAHRAETRCGPTVRRASAAPRPPHDEHELPDGRYLLAYRRAPDA